FVDANGAYSRKQALAIAMGFRDLGVSWFEEPVTADDLAGLRLLRDRLNCQVAAGEYGYTTSYFKQMLIAEAVDVLQADATRCFGITGFLGAATLCEAFHVPLSFHCAPAMHAAVGCSVPGLLHGEYFHDHARIEGMLFAEVPQPRNGRLRPDPERSGLGLEFKYSDAERYRIL
ncbi:MAG: mandelate racemase, partial [Verrucomicrobia bacterium]|nr:mandelate racemase [Verrucomicrobiota bacterium]